MWVFSLSHFQLCTKNICRRTCPKQWRLEWPREKTQTKTELQQTLLSWPKRQEARWGFTNWETVMRRQTASLPGIICIFFSVMLWIRKLMWIARGGSSDLFLELNPSQKYTGVESTMLIMVSTSNTLALWHREEHGDGLLASWASIASPPFSCCHSHSYQPYYTWPLYPLTASTSSHAL